MNKIRIGLVDDHKIVCDGIRAMLIGEHAMEMIAESPDAETMLQILEHTALDVLVVDISLPRMNGLELISIVANKYPSIRVLVLSGLVDEETMMNSLKAGACGYLSKDADAAEFLDAVRSVASGEEYFGGRISRIVFSSYSRIVTSQGAANGKEMLSDRETEIIRCFAEGLSYKETADALCISPRTVESHKVRIMEKLGLESLAALIRYAIRNGIIRL